jgi:hypothetical protein
MSYVDTIVNNFAKGVIAGIQNNIRNKRVTPYGAMNTTGQMADSLGYKWDGSTLIIFSTEKYFTVLETGRKPGKQPPTDPIQKWIQAKGIATDISDKSLAYLIARKIGKEGSLLYRQGGKSGVISDFINAQYIAKNLNEKFFLETVQTILNKLTDGNASN